MEIIVDMRNMEGVMGVDGQCKVATNAIEVAKMMQSISLNRRRYMSSDGGGSASIYPELHSLCPYASTIKQCKEDARICRSEGENGRDASDSVQIGAVTAGKM